jgi:hypothetical protein
MQVRNLVSKIAVPNAANAIQHPFSSGLQFASHSPTAVSSSVGFTLSLTRRDAHEARRCPRRRRSAVRAAERPRPNHSSTEQFIH